MRLTMTHDLQAHRWLFVSLLSVCPIQALAQVAVIPQGFDLVEGDSLTGFPLSTTTGRYQFLISAAQLQPLRDQSGWSIREILLRRDMTVTLSMGGGSTDLEILGGPAAGSPAGPFPDFAMNRKPGVSQVFRKVLTLSSIGAAPSSPAPWTSPYSVRLVLNSPITGDGDLLLEFVTRRVTGQPPVRFWAFDAVEFAAPGSVSPMGSTCPGSAPFTEAGVNSESLRPGSSSSFYLSWAPMGTLCLHVLGLSDQSFLGLPLPFYMGPLGAPGCSLYTDWVMVESKITSVRPTWGTGSAHLNLWWPLDPQLLGATFFSQWVLFEPGANPLGLTTTNGVKVTLSTAAASGGVGVVLSSDVSSPTGRVRTHFSPVFRLVK